jgi:hypothetical protein
VSSEFAWLEDSWVKRDGRWQVVLRQAVNRHSVRRLYWMAGVWVGSGGAYKSFYEIREAINDSTLRQRSFTDSTFYTISDSADIVVLRDGGIIVSRSGVVRWRALRGGTDTIRFDPATGTRGGMTWIRITDREWIEIIDGPVGALPVTYRMQLLAR